MTRDPICATPDTSCEAAAQRMKEHNCGALPVLISRESRQLAGIVTDRDLACREFVLDRRTGAPVTKAMTSPVVTVKPDSPLETCVTAMADHQVRRLIVVDNENNVIGIIAVADIARCADASVTGQLMKQLSAASRSGLA